MLGALALGVGIVQAYGSYRQGRAGERAQQANAEANRWVAAIRRQQADQTLVSYDEREEQFRRASKIAMGERRASAAQSGVGMGGSNADLERQAAVFAELDALNIRYEGQLAARELRLDAAGLSMGADSFAAQARATRTATNFAVLGDLMSAGASYQRASRYGRAG